MPPPKPKKSVKLTLANTPAKSSPLTLPPIVPDDTDTAISSPPPTPPPMVTPPADPPIDDLERELIDYGDLDNATLIAAYNINVGNTQDPDDPLMALSLLPNNFALDSIDGLDSFGDPQFLNIDLSSTSNNNQRASISSTLTPKGSKSPPTNQSSDLVPVKRAAYSHPLIRKALQNMDGSVPKPPKAPPTSPIAPEDMALLKFQRKPKVFSFNINLLLILYSYIHIQTFTDVPPEPETSRPPVDLDKQLRIYDAYSNTLLDFWKDGGPTPEYPPSGYDTYSKETSGKCPLFYTKHISRRLDELRDQKLERSRERVYPNKGRRYEPYRGYSLRRDLEEEVFNLIDNIDRRSKKPRTDSHNAFHNEETSRFAPRPRGMPGKQIRLCIIYLRSYIYKLGGERAKRLITTL